MTQLPQFARNSLKLILEPTGYTGLRRTLPLLFWQGYAMLNKKTVRNGPMPMRSPVEGSTSTLYSASFFLNHLTADLLPFWREHSLDTEYGGYFTHLDRWGQVYDDSAKYAAMQARLIYTFSASHTLQPQGGYLPLARHGVDFLLKYFWDNRHGGWYTSVQRDGLTIPGIKPLFNQAYVLFGLAEYYRVTRDPVVLDYLTRTYRLLEKHAWDDDQLGYYESCQVDWTLQSRRKTICIQLDMLRAVLALHLVTGEETYRRRAVQLGNVITKHMLDPHYGCVLEIFHPDWRYAPTATRDQVQIGHNVKGAWLLLRLNELEPRPAYVQAATRMIDFSLRYGWDNVHGGFFQQVYRTGPVASTVKEWWPESEGLNALLALYQLTGQTRYRDFFESLADFVFTHFVDHECGEWFTTCRADGTPLNDHKGGTYKSAYHTVHTCVKVWQESNGDLS